MIWFSLATALLATILYSVRTGQVFASLTRWEQLARFGVGITLVSLVAAILRRATSGEPILWTTYLITIALICTNVGYIGLFIANHRRGRSRS